MTWLEIWLERDWVEFWKEYYLLRLESNEIIMGLIEEVSSGDSPTDS